MQVNVSKNRLSENVNRRNQVLTANLDVALSFSQSRKRVSHMYTYIHTYIHIYIYTYMYVEVTQLRRFCVPEILFFFF